MNKDTIIRFAAIAAVVVATSATLPLCAAEVAADEAKTEIAPILAASATT